MSDFVLGDIVKTTPGAPMMPWAGNELVITDMYITAYGNTVAGLELEDIETGETHEYVNPAQVVLVHRSESGYKRKLKQDRQDLRDALELIEKLEIRRHNKGLSPGQVGYTVVYRKRDANYSTCDKEDLIEKIYPDASSQILTLQSSIKNTKETISQEADKLGKLEQQLEDLLHGT